MMSEADSGSTDQLAELATAKPATTSVTSSETETPSSLPLPSDQSSSSHPAPASSEEDGDASLNISKKVSSFNDYYYKTVDNFMSRLGASPIATAPVPADVSLAVEDILSKGLEGGGPPNDNRVSDIVWGWSTDGSADRQKAVYFRLNVSEKQASSGFSLHCRSKNKSKLRLFVFDKNGTLVEKTDAFRTRDKSLSQAILMFTGAETLKMQSQQEDAALVSWNKSPSVVFNKLDVLGANPAKLIPAGPYLIVVYIDNALLPGPFSLVALPAKQESEEHASLLHTENAIVEAKERLSLLEAEYVRNKAAYEATLAKMKDEDDVIDALLQSREDVYRNYLVSCGSAYEADSGAVEFDEFSTKANPSTNAPPSSSSSLDAGKILKAASAQASLASSWLSSRLSSGFNSLSRSTGAAPDVASVTSSTEGHASGTVKDEYEEEEESTTTAQPAVPPAPEQPTKSSNLTVGSAGKADSIEADPMVEEAKVSGLADSTANNVEKKKSGRSPAEKNKKEERVRDMEL